MSYYIHNGPLYLLSEYWGIDIHLSLPQIEVFKSNSLYLKYEFLNYDFKETTINDEYLAKEIRIRTDKGFNCTAVNWNVFLTSSNLLEITAIL